MNKLKAWARKHPKKLTAVLTVVIATLGPGWPVVAPLLSSLVVDSVTGVPEA